MAGPALAGGAATGDIYAGLTIDQFKAILTADGKTFTDEGSGDLRIKDGPLVSLTQCPKEDNGNCWEIEVSHTYDNVEPTLDAVNTWNGDYKIPEASVDKDGDLHVGFWLTAKGVTAAAISDAIGGFESAAASDETVKYWTPFLTDQKT